MLFFQSTAVCAADSRACFALPDFLFTAVLQGTNTPTDIVAGGGGGGGGGHLRLILFDVLGV